MTTTAIRIEESLREIGVRNFRFEDKTTRYAAVQEAAGVCDVARMVNCHQPVRLVVNGGKKVVTLTPKGQTNG